ncbi:MAG: hypothetical protein UY09_C0003G0008 [Parcubacteria group bacterium GW2011_GWA2_47_8]|nr:MAG: hypothetical protein UY09_C0003G0008 [Parcubacteria group bacterium GW2011_GWA2_47_8]OHB18439.1 MAG: hypothetical protein A2666_05130 [Parcubacteria group bacterium RIFCSPHIGHO2_01_FULL_47_10b]
MELLNVSTAEILGILGFLMTIIAFSLDQLAGGKSDKTTLNLLTLLGSFLIAVYLWSTASLILAILVLIWSVLALIALLKK